VTTESDNAPNSTKPDLTTVREQMQQGDFEPALVALDAILEQAPEDTEALYMHAVALRYLRRPEEARATLARLKALAPGHGRAHQEEGHLCRGLGLHDRALQAYTRAVQANPALEASFRGMLEILVADGRKAEALQVKARLDHLLSLPRPLVTVTDLIAQGKLLKAEDLCRRFMQKNPRHVEGMRLLADIGIQLGVLEDAEFLLESAVEFDPGNTGARIDYIHALRKRQKFARALEQAEALLRLDPGNPQFRSIHAIERMQTGDYDRALEEFDRVLARMPGDPNTLTSKGHALKTCGRADDAVAAYRQALVSQPRHGEACYSLANLKTYQFRDDELEHMQELEDDPNLGHMDRVYLAFALGKAHEDRKDFETSFRHYARGNALKKAQSRYDADRMREEFEAQMEVCDSALFESRTRCGHPAPDPIFILGLPRAGSTLLEQILSSHSAVDGTLELPNVLSLSQRLRRRQIDDRRPGYPGILHELDPQEFAAFGEAFIEDTRIHRQGAPLFIDKMPNNFRHIGLIHLMLPNAKIIDARRHPMACCFSGFKQLFAEGQEFSYDLEDVGRYYRDYVELMDHWDRVLPGRVLRVMHEDVVDDLEGQVRRMLDFCGLPFEESCLRYWETERNVRTPSSEQVRKPIFRDSVEQWRHYEPWLEPLKTALGPVLERYPIPGD
jgi:tetratricopeptide (TPR) repeat protein